MNSLLILGGAKCVWDDVASLGEWPATVDVAAVNDVGAKWPGKLVFWASLHPRKFKVWERQRSLNKYPDGYVRYSNKHGRPMIDKVSPDWHGSSGLFAVKVALELGYRNIVLAGIPMQADQAHYFDDKKWEEVITYKKGWLEHLDQIKPYVRSCSGWTRELLGGPEARKF